MNTLLAKDSSIVIEVIETVFFFLKDILNVKNKQKHLSNIQPDISISKKHLSNIQPDISISKKST